MGAVSDHAPPSTIRLETGEGLAVLTLARAEKRNAMNLSMFDEVGDACERISRDPSVRAVLVRGDGPSFCAGIDLGELGALAGAAADRGTLLAFAARAQRPFRLLATLAVPTVAAVRGHALGAGFQLALACDLRVAADDATFALLERRYGIVPDLGGIHRLVREIGLQRTKDLVWTGRTVDAEEAVRVGIALRAVPAASLDAAAERLAHELAGGPPVATLRSKQLIEGAGNRNLDEELAAEAELQLACLESEDHREAVAAFLERRSPVFRGR